MIDGFDWDEDNRSKCLKHGVSIEEIEALFKHEISIGPDVAHLKEETRFLGVGRTAKGRGLFIVFTIRMRGGKRYIRPISARYMHYKELERYEKTIS